MSTVAPSETARESAEETIRLTAGQAVVRYLQAQWSERDGRRQRVIPGIFGIFGHGNVCGLGQALQEHGRELPFYQPKNEQSMVHTAIGFAKATRRLSTLACTASIGPGSTNMVTGAATATTNRLPVLLLPSDTFANRRQGPVLQQLEHPVSADLTVNDCLRPVSRFFDRIARPEQLLTALPEAMRVLLDPADTGAVTVSLHQDVQGEAWDFPVSFFEPRTWRVTRRPPAREEIDAAVAAIRECRRPVIIAGGGVHYSAAGDALAALAERFGIPVAETSAGKGSTTSELVLGGIGVNGTGAANEIARDADLVICAGTRLSDFTTASHSLFQAPDVRFVGINVAASDASKLAAIPIVADAKLALEELAERLADVGWTAPAQQRASAADARDRWRAVLAADLAPRPDERMSQGQVLEALNAAATADDWVVAAAGSPPGDLLKMWDCPPGSSAHLEFAYSCMGHELPAGLGIRMARPDAGEIYVVIGDGTYLMANTELVTAVQEGLKVTVVLLVNGGYQSIHSLQLSTTGESFGNEFRARSEGQPAPAGDLLEPDYAANARSLGCDAVTVETLDELAGALSQARSGSRTTVIACSVEPRRMLLGSGAWWDLGVPQVSERAAVRERTAAHGDRAREHRTYV
jgi:3D-(3,5/4)-trihydroxycyclohexane-1,2-dione acylhydrolase (decyclizing)